MLSRAQYDLLELLRNNASCGKQNGEEEIFKSLYFIFSNSTKIVEASLEILDKGCVTCFQCQERKFYKVKSTNMSNEYLVLMDYCPCKSYSELFKSYCNNFHLHSTGKFLCKHILACRIAELLKKINVNIVNNERFVEILCNQTLSNGNSTGHRNDFGAPQDKYCNTFNSLH